jgi:hypothetical protein
MRFAFIASALAAAVTAQEAEAGEPLAGGQLAGAGAVPGTLATGPHKAAYWAEPSLPKHTIFAPMNPPAGLKMPVCCEALVLVSQSM